MRFSIAQKSTQNRKNLQSWRPMANRTGFLERPGGMSGGTGEGTMGRGQRSLHEFCMQCEAEFCRMLTCVWHALPRLDAGGGGKRERAFRRARFLYQSVCGFVGLFVCGVATK